MAAYPYAQEVLRYFGVAAPSGSKTVADIAGGGGVCDVGSVSSGDGTAVMWFDKLISDIEASIKRCIYQIYCKLWWLQLFSYFYFCIIYINIIWKQYVQNAQTIKPQYYKMCDTCRPRRQI